MAQRRRSKRKPTQSGESFSRPGKSELVKGLSHQARVEILSHLAQRVASPKQLSESLERSLTNVSYHVRVLDKLGLIELVEEEKVRGAVAHYYKAVERPLLSTDEWEQLPPEVRATVSAYGLDAIIGDATTALECGTFDSRPNRHLSRTPLLLDEAGFMRLAKLLDDALETVLAEQAESAARMTMSDEQPIHVVAAMLLFEMPTPDSTVSE